MAAQEECFCVSSAERENERKDFLYEGELANSRTPTKLTSFVIDRTFNQKRKIRLKWCEFTEPKGRREENKRIVFANSFDIMQRFQNFPNGKLVTTIGTGIINENKSALLRK